MLMLLDEQEATFRERALPEVILPLVAINACCAAAGSAASPILDEQSLARDQNWQRSRFGELEAFMVDFLVGGASAGESLRLKLQTPLFVSDALLEAARTQLAAELATAEQVHCAVPLELCFWLMACSTCHPQGALLNACCLELHKVALPELPTAVCTCRMLRRFALCRSS